MNLGTKVSSVGIGTYPDINPQNNYVNDINKVYIPFRPILEIELMLSSLLSFQNYEFVSRLPFDKCDANAIMDELGLDRDNIFHAILERFFNIVKGGIPVASVGRNLNSDELRYGNVNAYTESRVPLFYSIDRLKVKLLILKHFFETLRAKHYKLSAFPCYDRKADKSLISIMFAEYYSRMFTYFQTVAWEPQSKYLHQAENTKINYKALFHLNALKQKSPVSEINYIIRGLKSSLIVTRLLFSMLDVPDPFDSANGAVEELLLNRDFIPGMMELMNTAVRLNDAPKLREMVNLFLCYLNNVLEGINGSIAAVSNGQLSPASDEPLYYIGDILQ